MPARILIVEDNPANLELMRYLLTASGYAALSAEDGATGLSMARAETPDLVLCDIQLPGIDGYELVRAVRLDPVLRGTPVVAITAFAMASDREKALAAGFDGYLTKPLEPETFVSQVEAFLPAAARSAGGSPLSGASMPVIREKTAMQRTILVVDDRRDNLDLAEMLLGFSGYIVVTATSAADAWQCLRRAPPDLILSDLSIGAASGYEFIREVKADPELSAIPFIFITATASDEAARQRGLALGAARFLFRPIDSQELLNEIEACLRPRDG